MRSGAKRETKRAVLSETGRGGAGPVSRALGRALGPSELGRWELGRAERRAGEAAEALTGGPGAGKWARRSGWRRAGEAGRWAGCEAGVGKQS